MKKTLIYSSLVSFLLVGCGGGSSTQTTATPIPSATPSIVATFTPLPTPTPIVNIEKSIIVSDGYVMSAKGISSSKKEFKEVGNGKYNIVKNDENLEIFYFFDGYSDSNQNGKLDTYEIGIPLMMTYSYYNNANPFTTFFVSINGSGNEKAFISDLNLPLESFDIDVVEYSKNNPNNNEIAKLSLMLSAVNNYYYLQAISNQNISYNDNINKTNLLSSSILPTLWTSTNAITNVVNTTQANSSILPVKRTVAYETLESGVYKSYINNANFMNLYIAIKNAKGDDVVSKFVNAIISTIDDTNINLLVKKILSYPNTTSLKDMEIDVAATMLQITKKPYLNIASNDEPIITSSTTPITTNVSNSSSASILPTIGK